MKTTMPLSQAPHGRTLRVTAVHGGEGARRRLLALGFHRDDLIEINAEGILRGPLLVRNLRADSSVALGRGIAQKIEVEVLPDPEAASPDEH